MLHCIREGIKPLNSNSHSSSCMLMQTTHTFSLTSPSSQLRLSMSPILMLGMIKKDRRTEREREREREKERERKATLSAQKNRKYTSDRSSGCTATNNMIIQTISLIVQIGLFFSHYLWAFSTTSLGNRVHIALEIDPTFLSPKIRSKTQC